MPARGQRLLAVVYGWAFTVMLWFLHATWRTRTGDIAKLDDLLSRGERLVACFWHGDYIPLFILMRDHDAYVFTSASFRGLVIARLCRNFGYRAVLIPEHGEEAYQQMRAASRDAGFVAIAADGPLGPWHVPKRGPIRLSSELRMALLPVSVAGSRRWIHRERWDRRMIPRPFSQVSIAIGEMLRPPAGLNDDEIESWQNELRREMEATDRRAEEMLRTGS